MLDLIKTESTWLITCGLTCQLTDWLMENISDLSRRGVSIEFFFCCFSSASLCCSDPSSFILSCTITSLLLGDISESFSTGLLWSSRSPVGRQVSPAYVCVCVWLLYCVQWQSWLCYARQRQNSTWADYYSQCTSWHLSFSFSVPLSLSTDHPSLPTSSHSVAIL